MHIHLDAISAAAKRFGVWATWHMAVLMMESATRKDMRVVVRAV